LKILPELTVFFNEREQELKHNSNSMVAIGTNIAINKIVLKHKKSEK
jgi:hypothetical protein